VFSDLNVFLEVSGYNGPRYLHTYDGPILFYPEFAITFGPKYSTGIEHYYWTFNNPWPKFYEPGANWRSPTIIWWDPYDFVWDANKGYVRIAGEPSAVEIGMKNRMERKIANGTIIKLF
jgi:hypothetical protein